jgi:putative transposase
MYKAFKYNPLNHHRRSIRLKGYDYSRPGMYFITICVQSRDCLFGEIIDKIMNLNDVGKMVEKWYIELENKFPDIKCHAMIVMPNHFHCIIENTGVVPVSDDVPVGADLCVCPCHDGEHEMTDGHSNWGDHDLLGNPVHWGEHDLLGNPVHWGEHDILGNPVHWGEHAGSPLQRVVQWFKTMTTNEYIRGVKNLGWQLNGKLWQRNYYEHIIRNNQSYQKIADYIMNNPARWNDDKFLTRS